MRAVSESDAMQTLPSLLKEAKTQAVEIRDGDEVLGAIVSKEDYELIRRAKAEDFLRASTEFGEQLRARAGEEGITTDDLARILD